MWRNFLQPDFWPGLLAVVNFRIARHPGRTQETPAQQFFFGEASDAIFCIPMI
jgi:hypothetical protein